VGDLSVVQRPVGVLDSSTNGWRDLAVSVSGGGNPGGTMKLMFDGKAYPSNPTVAPAEPVDSLGTVLIGQGPLARAQPGFRMSRIAGQWAARLQPATRPDPEFLTRTDNQRKVRHD